MWNGKRLDESGFSEIVAWTTISGRGCWGNWYEIKSWKLTNERVGKWQLSNIKFVNIKLVRLSAYRIRTVTPLNITTVISLIFLHHK